MKDKICLITGANAGIGKTTALGLAKLGARIVIISRNKERGEKALKEIASESGNENIDLFTADLASFASIRKLAKEIRSRYDKLDVLINNAGIFVSELQYTEDKIEMQWGVNHLAPFLLTHLLMDTLKKAGSARIVNVSSRVHLRGTIHFNGLNLTSNYDGLRAYSQSKLANVLFTYELAARLEGTGVTANCLHPGGVKTHFVDKNASGFYKVGWILLKPFMISPTKGAETSVYLASSEEVKGVTGKYFDKCRPKRSSRRSYDKAVAKRLWEVSEELTADYADRTD